MKTEASEYLSLLQEIQNNNVSTFTVMPADEPRFTIETNSRNIIVPSEFSFLSVQNDHRAETIYFEIDRYFDNVDLSQHTCVVQFINKSGTTINEGTYPVTSMDIDSVDGKIVFGWEIRNDATQLTGDITFSVRFYSIDNNGNFTYNFNTLTASSYILPSLNIIASGERITATELEVWTDKMNNLASSIESDIITVEEKIEEFENYIASISEDYTALTEEVSQLSSENAELKGYLDYIENDLYRYDPLILEPRLGCYSLVTKEYFEYDTSWMCVELPISQKDKLLVSTSAGRGASVMAFFYSDLPLNASNFISVIGEENTPQIYRDKELKIPTNAKYVAINYDTHDESSVTFEIKKRFLNDETKKSNVSYKNNRLVINSKNVRLTFSNRGVNNLFMLSEVKTKHSTKTIGTDWISPFKFGVVNNGTNNDQIHTGGNHGTDGGGGGNPTAYTESVKVFVDDVEFDVLDNELFDTLKFDIVNFVTAYNTIENGNVLRYPLKEIQHYTFENNKLSVEIELIAQEDIKIIYYHGLQISDYYSKGSLIGFNEVKLKDFTFAQDTYTDYMPKLVKCFDGYNDFVEMEIEKIGIANSTKVNGAKFGSYTYGKAGWNLVLTSWDNGEELLNGERTICIGSYTFN